MFYIFNPEIHKKYKLLIIQFILIIGFILAPFSPIMADTKTELESQLKDIENQITLFEKELKNTKTEKKTLQNKISNLKKTQESLKLQIKKTALEINNLEIKITDTEKQIDKTKIKMAEAKNNLAEIIKQLNRKDSTTIVQILGSENNLAEFYNQIYDYIVMTDAIKDLSQTINKTQKELSIHQDGLEDKQDSQKNLLSLKTLQQKELVGALTEQSELLKETQGKEVIYQQNLEANKKKAAEIKSRIYELIGGGKQINFGTALELANWVSGVTGIRPAFLLAVLTQESNLGKNTGTCNRPGDPPEKSWKVIMKPTRDQEPFKTITEELGRNPDVTPVSCPMKNKDGSQLGWGGAMGPAQFIPSTWMGYRKKITAITGKSADPWDNRDAFLAAGIKLTADGANGTEDGDWKAAMKYFSGSTNTKYRFYGDNVIKTTNKYLADIADLNAK